MSLEEKTKLMVTEAVTKLEKKRDYRKTLGFTILMGFISLITIIIVFLYAEKIDEKSIGICLIPMIFFFVSITNIKESKKHLIK